MELPKTLKDEIWEYSRLNDITNIDEFTIKLITQGFTMEKFGATPQQKTIEKIVEKIVEVPVEKIVEKIITNDEETKKLVEELQTEKANNEVLKKEIEELKKLKTKRDIYGE